MRKRTLKATISTALLTTLFAATSFPVMAAEDSATTFGEAFTKGKFGYSFRWRLENVDQDPLPHDATAIPLRARINCLAIP
jgi:hypothetical protein